MRTPLGPVKILIVEDEVNLRVVLQKELQRLGHTTQVAGDGAEALTLLEEETFEVVLADINMPRLDGMTLLGRLSERNRPPEVIILTGYATIESAIAAMKLGAYDYLSKPYHLAELDALVRRAAEKYRLRADNQRLRQQLTRRNISPEIIAASGAMKDALRLVAKAAPSDVSILITGASGTGKELIAQRLHYASRRADGPFIDLNCAALQESLLESELFGYEAGAFSGAKGRKLGLFELAESGTLFLDEITELPASLQAKLLRALETRSFYRVGGTRKVEVNVRIVAATNRDPEQAVEEKVLRADLLYRLNGLQIHLLPLHERPEDITPLAEHLLRSLSQGASLKVAPEVWAALRIYHWPGNVRQLRNCLERAWLLAHEGHITLDELPPEVARLTVTGLVTPMAMAALSESPEESGFLRSVERQQIVTALEQTNWHRGQAAKFLGISPSTLYRRLREYGLAGEE